MEKKLTDFGFREKYLTLSEMRILFGKKFKDVRKMEERETPHLDVTKYVGTKTTIVKAEVKQGKFGKFIMLETAPIDLIDGDKLPTGIYLRGTKILGLFEDDKGIFIGKESKTSTWLRENKVKIADIPDDLEVGDLIKCLEGIKVTVQKNEDNPMFLSIA